MERKWAKNTAEQLFAAAIHKNLNLLIQSNKDIDLVAGVYGKQVLKRHTVKSKTKKL